MCRPSRVSILARDLIGTTPGARALPAVLGPARVEQRGCRKGSSDDDGNALLSAVLWPISPAVCACCSALSFSSLPFLPSASVCRREDTRPSRHLERSVPVHGNASSSVPRRPRVRSAPLRPPHIATQPTPTRDGAGQTVPAQSPSTPPHEHLAAAVAVHPKIKAAVPLPRRSLSVLSSNESTKPWWSRQALSSSSSSSI